jgi:hypothetical protein
MKYLLLALSLSGCAGSFGAPGSPARCVHLDAGERWSGAVAKASLAVSGVSAGVALPTESKAKQDVLLITAMGTAAFAAGALYLEDSYQTDRENECKK